MQRSRSAGLSTFPLTPPATGPHRARAASAADADVSSPAPDEPSILDSVLACRRGHVLDLRALAEPQARALFGMPDENWQTLADTSEPPITEIRLPPATRRKHLKLAIQGLNRLTGLRQLHLEAPPGNPQVALQGLRHPQGQLAVTLTLPASGGHTISLPPRLALRTTSELPGLATGKHWARTITAGQQPLEPRHTLPDWPYVRRLDPAVAQANQGGMPVLALTRDRTFQLSLYRLVRQALLDAGAGLAAPVASADDQLRTLNRAWQALHDDPPDLDALLAGLGCAFTRRGAPDAVAAQAGRRRFRYDYARTAQTIDQHVGSPIEQLATRLLEHAPTGLANPELPGDLLAEHLTELREGEARYLLVCGKAHVLALVLRRRQGMQASVVCYDPHMPATHVRMVTADRPSLRQLNLARLLPPGSADRYFGANRPRIIGLYDLRQLLPAQAQGPYPVARTRVFGLTGAHQARAQFLEMSMYLGPASAASSSLRMMDTSAGLTPLPELASRMTGTPGSRPLLQEAIRRDRIHHVAAYFHEVLTAESFARRPQLRAHILRAAYREPAARVPARRPSLHKVTALRQAAGIGVEAAAATPDPLTSTALSLALQCNPQATGLLVRQLAAHPRAVPPHLQRILLLEADARGVPLVYRLLARQATPASPQLALALYAYAYEIAACTTLSPAVKQELLLAAHSGETAIMTGIRNGQATAAAAWACAVFDAPMPQATRATLVAALRAPLRALPVALNLDDPYAQDWAARLLPSLGRVETEAALSAHLHRAWSRISEATDWTLQPEIQALLQTPRLQVSGTLHDDDDFELADLRPWRADESQLLFICTASIALRELEGWRMAPTMRHLDDLPTGSRPMYLLPVERLSAMAVPAGSATPTAAPSVAAAASLAAPVPRRPGFTPAPGISPLRESKSPRR